MEANFAAIDSVGVIKAVQFVDQKTNDTDNLQNGFTLTFDPTKPGYNQNIHRDSKYKIDNNAVAGKPQMALPFIDVENTVDIPFYKWNQFRVNQATKAGDYIFFDGPGVSNISIIIKEYDCKLEFTTYLVLSYADPVNPLTTPLTRLPSLIGM